MPPVSSQQSTRTGTRHLRHLGRNPVHGHRIQVVLLLALAIVAGGLLSCGDDDEKGQCTTPTTADTLWIYDGQLRNDCGMGVNTSGGRTDWVSEPDDVIRMDYPSGQTWGAVFITINGDPVDKSRPCQDFSAYSKLLVDLRGENGGESIEIGIKDNEDPDTGAETKITVPDLPTEWETYEFPLTLFETADITRIYVVAEFVFDAGARTVHFRNLRYTR